MGLVCELTLVVGFMLKYSLHINNLVNHSSLITFKILFLLIHFQGFHFSLLSGNSAYGGTTVYFTTPLFGYIYFQFSNDKFSYFTILLALEKVKEGREMHSVNR